MSESPSNVDTDGHDWKPDYNMRTHELWVCTRCKSVSYTVNPGHILHKFRIMTCDEVICQKILTE